MKKIYLFLFLILTGNCFASALASALAQSQLQQQQYQDGQPPQQEQQDGQQPTSVQLKSQSQRDSIRNAARRAERAANVISTLYHYDYDLHCGIPLLDTVDISLANFQIYDNAFKQNNFFQTIDLGQADLLIGNEPDFKGSINLRNDPFSTWKYTVENTPFYQTKNPYPSLYYVNNLGKEINMLTAIFSMNVARGLNLAIDFNVLSWFGEYENSGSNQMNFRGYGNYITKDGRYRLQLGYIFNRSKINENGGIADDSVFIRNEETNRLSIPVNLNQANNHYRENIVFLKHSYHFYSDRRDTIPENDYSFGFVGHEFLFKQNREMYDDASWGDFYSNGFLNSGESRDTVNSYRFTNRVYYTTADMERARRKAFDFKIAAGIKNEYVYFRDAVSKINMLAWFPFVRVQFSFAGRFVLDAYGDFSFDNNTFKSGTGRAAIEDYDGYVSAKFLFAGQKKAISEQDGVSLKAGYKTQTPDYIFSHHFSNHFYWDDDKLKNLQTLYAGLDFSYKGWWLKANVNYTNNYTFFKKGVQLGDIIRVQADEWLLSTYLSLGKNLIIAKYLGLNSKLQLSYSGNQEYLHVPLFNMLESIFGIIPMPGGGTLQVGLDFYYHTAYYADIYNPAIAYFSWQDEVKTGDYLIMDFFVNLKVKRMNIFFKGQNLLQGATPYNYIDTPHYPLKDRCFRFGLVWRFYD
ncbi:MAG: putative porin [Bacteroidales bacterium]|nr:putative porin [Bacteroidales bacterium]